MFKKLTVVGGEVGIIVSDLNASKSQLLVSS